MRKGNSVGVSTEARLDSPRKAFGKQGRIALARAEESQSNVKHRGQGPRGVWHLA